MVELIFLKHLNIFAYDVIVYCLVKDGHYTKHESMIYIYLLSDLDSELFCCACVHVFS